MITIPDLNAIVATRVNAFRTTLPRSTSTPGLGLARGRLKRFARAPDCRTQLVDSVIQTFCFTHSDLAAMAALSRPHVSVLMTEFRGRRLVSYGRGGPLRVLTARLRRIVDNAEDQKLISS